jgi:hypothetical protein
MNVVLCTFHMGPPQERCPVVKYSQADRATWTGPLVELCKHLVDQVRDGPVPHKMRQGELGMKSLTIRECPV